MDYTTIRNEIILYEQIIKVLEKKGVDINIIDEIKSDIVFTCSCQKEMLNKQLEDKMQEINTIKNDLERYDYIIDKYDFVKKLMNNKESEI